MIKHGKIRKFLFDNGITNFEFIVLVLVAEPLIQLNHYLAGLLIFFGAIIISGILKK